MRLQHTILLSCSLFLIAVTSVSAADRLKRSKGDIVPQLVQTTVVTPVTVLSIIPAQAEPGGRVVLSGSGFGDSASVILGSTEIPVKITDGRTAELNVPMQTEAGLYALYVKRSDGAVGRVYNFTVVPLKPQLLSIQPSQISSCAVGREREITLKGNNFNETSLAYFDGAALAGTVNGSDTLSFLLPPAAGGLHQIQVKNSGDNGSVTMGIIIETKPDIAQVSIGTEHVNFYELIISGKNFSRNSSLYVDGYQIGGRGGQDMTEREKLVYVDCSTLIYQRHPYSPVRKDFRIQVVNPGGEGSQVVTVSAP